MATRTITECDRCRSEIGTKFYKKSNLVISVNKGTVELCSICGDKFDKFMKGQDCFGTHPDPDP